MFNACPGCDATCPLSSCSTQNDGHAVASTVISTVACKGPVCVEVLTTFYGRLSVEVGHFNQLKVSPLGPPFFS